MYKLYIWLIYTLSDLHIYKLKATNIDSMETHKKEQKPIMAWGSQEPFDQECKVVWWSRVDNRYQVEVHRTSDRSGTLLIFDHENNDKVILTKSVNLSYGAKFGPDVMDVELWKGISIDAIDGKSNVEIAKTEDFKSNVRKFQEDMTHEEKLAIVRGIDKKIREEREKYSGSMSEHMLSDILKFERKAMLYEAADDLYSAALWYCTAASSSLHTLKSFDWTEELLLRAKNAVNNCPPEKNRGSGFGSAEEDIYYTKKSLEDLKKLPDEDISEIALFLEQESRKYNGTMPIEELDRVIFGEQLALLHLKLTDKVYKNKDPTGFAAQNFTFAAQTAIKNGNVEWARDLIKNAKDALANSVPGPQYSQYYFPNLANDISSLNDICQGTKTFESYIEEKRKALS